MGDSSLEQIVLTLFEIGAVKFGSFTLKSGLLSPFYIDLRVLVSRPAVLRSVADLFWQHRPPGFQCVCGVPYTALPIATLFSADHDVPMLIRRREAKGYGTKRMVEGLFSTGDSCLILEDVIVSGSSVLETALCLRDQGLEVTDVVVFIDRLQGGHSNLAKHGIRSTAVCNIESLLEILHRHGVISDQCVAESRSFLAVNNSTAIRIDEALCAPVENERTSLSLENRRQLAVHPLVRRLLAVITAKQSNLCLAVDVQSSSRVLQLADLLGPHICVLKTHCDSLDGADPEFGSRLRALADRHSFLVLEDRKYADIGATVARQYAGGLWRVKDWADLVTAHALPGPGVLGGLESTVADDESRGVLLVAEMSSVDNLLSANYATRCVQMAREHPRLVCCFIAQSSVCGDPGWVVMTPGVNLSAGSDALDQRYRSPEQVVLEAGADVVVVGRGVTEAEDPLATTLTYKQRAFSALVKRTANAGANAEQ